MGSGNKTYYLAPTRDCPPSGPIALGNVILSPRSPEVSLCDPKSQLVCDLVKESFTTTEVGTSREIGSESNISPKVFAKFLSFSGIGGDIGFDRGRDKSATYNFTKLTTITINPSLASIQALFQEPAIQQTIRDSKFRKNLYMITGVQIAHGAEYVILKARTQGKHLNVQADLTAAGPPISVGVGLDVSSTQKQTVKGQIESDFVFAYRLREILYRRKKVENIRDIRDGDLMGRGERSRETKKRLTDADYVPELYALKDEDSALPGLWDLKAESGADGEEGYQCVIVEGIDHSSDDDD